MAPLLGWISPKDRTPAQNAAHARALVSFPRFAVPGHVAPAGPVKVMLTDFWKRPEVVADIGFEFTGFHQLTGSCVGASAGNAVATLAAVQRCLSQGMTRAFAPWWPYAYGRTRFNEGDRGEGEGAIDSVMAETLIQEGTFAITEKSGLPAFDRSDGLALTSPIEMRWSNGAAPEVTDCLGLGKQHPIGSAAVLNSTDDIKTAILNGYPVLDGCNDYIGHGSIQGSGDNACVVGQYDGRGGHSTCYLGYWDHPNLGPLFLYSNQWPTDTYPKDPAGAGRCCVWVKEATVARLFQLGGSDGETVALSHLNYFPAQPQLLDWYV